MFMCKPSYNVLLQMGFVQSLVCCDLILKYVSRFQSIFTELSLVTGQSTHLVCTLSCDAGKKLDGFSI